MIPIVVTGSIFTALYGIGVYNYQTSDNPFNDYKSCVRFNKIPIPFSRNLKREEDLLEGTFYPTHAVGYWFSEWYNLQIVVEGTRKEWDDFNIIFKFSFGFTRIENSFRRIRVCGYKMNPVLNMSRLPLLLYIKGPINKDYDDELIYDKTIYVK